MGLFIAQEEGPLEEVSYFKAAVAGAELNVAIALGRLGHEISYLTKLGDDSLGQRIRRTMETNGIHTGLVTQSKELSTGFMMKGKNSHGDPAIQYFRKGSAASALSVEDVEKLDYSSYNILHMTGILPALSDSAKEAAFTMMEKAKSAGLTIFFDPNLRPQLWTDERAMIDTINKLALKADYVLPGYKEGGVLLGTTDAQKIARYYLSMGIKGVVVKTGAKGAYAATKEKEFLSPAFYAEKVVDTVGAGDGFAAGVLSAVAEGLSLEEAVRRGNAIGTMQIMSEGDNEGLPTRDNLERFMRETPLDEETAK